MADEIRLVPTKFGELAVGTKFMMPGGGFFMVKTSEGCCRYDSGAQTYKEASNTAVLAIRPAEPPIDRARVLAVLRSHSRAWCVECSSMIANGAREHKTGCELAAVIALLEEGQGNG